jgi:uncharacterized protein (DUF2062 family)
LLFFRLNGYLKRKLFQPLLQLLQQGITPKKLAVTTAMGAVLGIMPLLGVTTVIGTYLALRLRLNVALLVLIIYLMYPIQIVLYIPFMQAGLYFFEVNDFRLTLSDTLEMFRVDWFLALRKLWFANLVGILVWLLFSAPVFGLLYLTLLPLYKKFSRVKPGPAVVLEPASSSHPTPLP